jgi:hypothetical protein
MAVALEVVEHPPQKSESDDDEGDAEECHGLPYHLPRGQDTPGICTFTGMKHPHSLH